MTPSSRPPADAVHRRRILIAALVLVGACLVILTLVASIYVPLEDDSDIGIGQQQTGAPQ